VRRRAAPYLCSVDAQHIEDDERHWHGQVVVQDAATDEREARLAVAPGDELAIERQSRRQLSELRQDRRHVPASPVTKAKAFLRRDERA
jgi:hypothetical protein